jgi:hypothetical protein
VQLQPGQSRSGQAGSECCHSSGDWRVRSVHSEEAGREDSAPKTFHHCDADAVSLAQGRMRSTDNARLPAVAGVPSPGHAFKETPREPRRAPYLSRNRGVRFRPTQMEPGPRGERVSPREANEPSTRRTLLPRETGGAGMGRRAVLRAHSTDEGGEPQGSRKGRPRYPLEGRGKQVDASAR